MSHTPCPICREHHETDRGLSYDGKGINACGMYRNRLATFQSNAPEHLGPLFAAAPELLAACKAAELLVQMMAPATCTEHDRCRLLTTLSTAIYKSECR